MLIFSYFRPMTIWFFKYKEKDYFFSFVISFKLDDHSVTAGKNKEKRY